MRTSLKASLAVAAGLMLAAGALPSPADAAKRKSCTRGGAKLELSSGATRIVSRTVKLQSQYETRREHIYACWRKTGKRIKIVEEVDNGLDNIASTRVAIIQGRWVGVVATNTGGVSEHIAARVYDARRRTLVHTSAECDKVDQGDFGGVEDVVFLDDGGMAMACRQLLLYRDAGAEVEVLEPPGTWVRQLAVSRYSRGFGQRLFWHVGDGDGEAKSIAI